ncbi:hypothetical protein [Lysobacter fragariae]
MNARTFAGYLCVGLGFALIVLLGSGVIGPFGPSLGDAPSIGMVLLGLLPSVLCALALFVAGLWLLKAKGNRTP